ncbi:two-component regulator propeller domain-containing protein [Flavihumibacter solisilvae]|uniref:PorZ N-terminal beta-propeller domain-containing protein n=1 Tax=Flavihumibacter solisilvae TaxID=1349421 RepID=A0A0C1L7D9_9BACT|nr:two-component regulator propeller domain-containing protein [Flavihumibacter solisilvae]KIC96082.1 hypothetical protein OI18_02630 [Flavihumibacter solisilvae]
MRYLVICFLLFFGCSVALIAQPIGSWQEHLPYNSAISLADDGEKIYAATPYAFFSVNRQNDQVERFSRIKGLAETGMRLIHYAGVGQLVAIYRHGNIDIIENQGITNLPAYRDKQVDADKVIYDISGSGENCLLSAGYGIIVLNLVKKEIGDTWVIGNNGAFTKVNAAVRAGSFYYAATLEGLKKAPAAGVNLADYRNWQTVSGTAGLPTGEVQRVLTGKDSVIYVQAGSTLYRQGDAQFQQVYSDDWTWKHIQWSGDRLLISRRKGSNASIQVLYADGSVETTVSNPMIQFPFQAIYTGTTLWVADSLAGLLEMNNIIVEAIVPGGPGSVGSGDIIAGRGDWWAATGTSISRFRDNNWTVYNGGGQPIPASFGRPGPLVIDKGNVTWSGSVSGGGLLRIHNETFTLMPNVISPAANDPNSFRVKGLASDNENNLWISNDGAAQGLVLLYPDNRVQKFTIPFMYRDYAVADLIIDDLNQKWMISPGNGLFCYNAGASNDNTGDDQWRYYRAGQGNGNLPSNNVLSLVKDDFGFIWVGTDNGIGIVQCPDQVFNSTGCEAVLPVVQADNFAGYLFKGEAVQAMAVDGANRKWIGTKNGLWLISPGGEKTILRFTVSNSPLLSNDVRKIAIDPDGTVVISTAEGICSYRGDATQVSTGSGNVLVFPNPVPPGYNGTIAVRGLVTNAIVKITELNGRLVTQGRANGGQFTWNGRDLNGRQISTGVYLVFTTDESRKEQLVTKIVFIQR